MWTQNARPTLYGQWLAWQITADHCIDPGDGVEPVKRSNLCSPAKLDVVLKDKKEAIQEARSDRPGLILWTDGSRLDQGQTAAAVCWHDKLAAKWKEKSVFLGQNKEILDAELWAISEALKIAKNIVGPDPRQ